MYLFLILTLLTLLLNLSSVQTALSTYVVHKINEDFGVSIQISKVKSSLLTWKVSLEDVMIVDSLNDTIVYVKSIQTKLYDLGAFNGGDISLSQVAVDGLHLEINTPLGGEKSYFDEFVDALDQSSGNGHFLLSADGLVIKNSEVFINDPNKEVKQVFFKHIAINSKDFKIDGPVVTTSVKKLSTEINKGLLLDNSALNLYYSPTQIICTDVNLKSNDSQFKGSVSMDYEPGDFRDFYNKVMLHISMEDALIATDDLNRYFPMFGKGKTASINAKFDGVANRLNAEINYLNISNTGIRGNYTFENLFDGENQFQIEGAIKNIKTSIEDLKEILPEHLSSLPNNINRLGELNFTGTALVTSDVLEVRSNISTSLGHLYSDLQMEGIQHIETAKYKGFVSLIDFDFGGYLFDNASFTQTTMDANIEGAGFLRANVNTKAEGMVYQTTYNGYTYKNISLSGLFKNELFDGSIKVDDEFLKMEFQGLADFTNNPNKFQFNAAVEKADFYQMNFVRDSIALFKGVLKSNMIGTSVDDMLGEVSFYNTQYINLETTYNFEDFEITATEESKGNRNISINSKDIITGYVRGEFKVEEFPYIFKNAMGSIYSNYKPFSVTKNQKFDFNFKVYNKLIEVFLPDLKFKPNTFIKGSVAVDEDDMKIDFKSPGLSFQGAVLDTVMLKIDTKNPLYKSYLAIENIKAKGMRVGGFEMINNSLKDTLFFRTEFNGRNSFKDKYAINFYHTFNEKDESVIGLKRSNIKIKGYQWEVNKKNNKENKIVYNSKRDSLFIEPFEIESSTGEKLRLEGYLRDSTVKNIQLNFDRVALRKITPTIDSLALDGIVNGVLSFQQQDSVYYPSTKVAIEKFNVNNFELGDMNIDLLGNRDLTDFIVNAKLFDQEDEKLRIIGDVYHSEGSLTANLLASFNAFKLEPFSPLGEDVIHHIRGSLFGNAKVSGDLINPIMEGELTLSQGGVKFPYLNMDYSFAPTETIVLNNQSFIFDDLTFKEGVSNTSAVVSGNITHAYFKDWDFDLKIDATEAPFMVLNTNYEPESMYYGQGYFVGSSTIKGLTKSLDIAIDGTTSKGTSIKIPIEDAVSVGDYEFINFVERSTKKLEDVDDVAVNYSGLDLAFNLEVTPEAEVEIVIDPNSGSSLKGTGSGNLFMDINTLGKFNMFGEFTVATGVYNYRFGGFIDKKFKVKSGGRISWEGDPLQAQLELEAAYDLYANPAPLLENPGFTKRIQTEVLVRLNGALENPNIDFDIEFPGTNSVVKSELLYSLQDPTVQDRNAFFLLAQGTFVNDATGINQQAVTGNLLQSASGFLSSILDSKSENFNFGVSYEQGFIDKNSNLQTDNKIGFSLSTQLSDRVLFNGRLGVPVGGGVADNVVAGDAELQVLLNEDGTLSAKVFNRENEYQQLLLDYQGYTQGVGLTYKVDYNSFSELFRKIIGIE